MTGPQFDSPLSDARMAEPIECCIWFVDRMREPGVKALRSFLGGSMVQQALAVPGRWLIALLDKDRAGVCTVTSEADILYTHRKLLELNCGAHVVVHHYLEPSLRDRVIADSKEHALRLAEPVGSA